MKSSFSNIHYVVSFLLTCLFSSVLLSQQKGIKKAEFFDKKVIIIEEVTENGKTDTTNSEIDVPENYTANSGDEFTLSFLTSKYDRKGNNEQIIPYVNLGRKLFVNEVVTYIKRDTIQLPDQIIAIGDHFTLLTQGEDYKNDFWVDDRSIMLLWYCMISDKDYFISYQKDYSKNKNNGEICTLINGQYSNTTKWEVIDFEKPEFILNINREFSKRFGGFKISTTYKLDKYFNPKSYIEHWNN